MHSKVLFGNSIDSTSFLYQIWQKRGLFLVHFWSILDEVRPISSAEPSVKLTEPVRLGRNTFLADRSFTKVWKIYFFGV